METLAEQTEAEVTLYHHDYFGVQSHPTDFYIELIQIICAGDVVSW